VVPAQEQRRGVRSAGWRAGCPGGGRPGGGRPGRGCPGGGCPGRGFPGRGFPGPVRRRLNRPGRRDRQHGPGRLQVPHDGALRRHAEGHDAVLVALSGDANRQAGEVDVRHIEPDEFGDPQRRGVEQFDDRQVANGGGIAGARGDLESVQQLLHLGAVDHPRQGPAWFRRAQAYGRVTGKHAFPGQPGREAPGGCGPPGDGGPCQTRLRARPQPVAEQLERQAVDRVHGPVLGKGSQTGQVCAVRAHGVRREAALGGEVTGEAVYRRVQMHASSISRAGRYTVSDAGNGAITPRVPGRHAG